MTENDLNLLRKIYYLVRVIPKLGFWNFMYVVWYRLSIRFGWRKFSFLTEPVLSGQFYQPTEMVTDFPFLSADKIIKKADEILNGLYTYFHFHKHHIGNPPDWFLNPFNGKKVNSPGIHWTLINDFNLSVGDIKAIWEPSRFDWLTDLARAYRLTGEGQYLDQINILLNSWCVSNPLNIGPNWKCGQEASLRVMKLITTAQLLNQFERPTKLLTELVHQHLKRISPNINYAIAQDNNHATSETAALYIGSSWLINASQFGTKELNELNKWKVKGREVLESLLMDLVSKDGSFSQQSVNYHRLVLDTMSWVLSNMKLLNELPFKIEIKNRLDNLGKWLYEFVETNSGFVPLIGANDGAMIENLHNCSYKDYKPSVQLYFAINRGYLIYTEGPHDEPIFWRLKECFNYLPRNSILRSKAKIIDNEYVILRRNNVEVFLKIPNNKFRPMNNPFHIDVWANGKNIAIGPGSYSYNAGHKSTKYKSIQSVNSIQFGNYEPMPYISRFLNGAWIKANKVNIFESPDCITWLGEYKDYKSNLHKRQVRLFDSKLEVIDDVISSENSVLNWHFNLFPHEIQFADQVLSFNGIKVSIGGAKSIDLFEDYHSSYYLHEEQHTRVSSIFKDNIIITTFHF